MATSGLGKTVVLERSGSRTVVTGHSLQSAFARERGGIMTAAILPNAGVVVGVMRRSILHPFEVGVRDLDGGPIQVYKFHTAYVVAGLIVNL